MKSSTPKEVLDQIFFSSTVLVRLWRVRLQRWKEALDLFLVVLTLANPVRCERFDSRDRGTRSVCPHPFGVINIDDSSSESLGCTRPRPFEEENVMCGAIEEPGSHPIEVCCVWKLGRTRSRLFEEEKVICGAVEEPSDHLVDSRTRPHSLSTHEGEKMMWWCD